MSISIDRQALSDTILNQYAKPLAMRDWAGHEAAADPSWKWDYDPERATELLKEAGYPDGFRITLTPSIRGAPAEVDACDAVGSMWTNIGIDVQLQHIPYSTLRPSIITRNYVGATCHAVSIRLDPIIGASNYVKSSVFSYGTEHPWMEDRLNAAFTEVDSAKRQQETVEVYDWMYRNVMAFGLYSFDAVWPLDKRLEKWEPVDWSEVRIANGFEYAKLR